MSLIFPFCVFNKIPRNYRAKLITYLFNVVRSILRAVVRPGGCWALAAAAGAPGPPGRDRTSLCLSGCTSAI